MAFSLGSTPVVVTSDHQLAKEVLTSPHFADRPIKQSARSLMFSRAIGFAPNGTYWRLLRRIAASHLFAPRRIAAHEPGRQKDCAAMLRNIADEQSLKGAVSLRKHLQAAALNNIMGSVFGRRYDTAEDSEELRELKEMVREGFELLGAFNWSDYLPWLSYFYDPFRVVARCEALVPRVRKLVKGIIEQHKAKNQSENISDASDFVDILLSLDGDQKLDEEDMIAVLWVCSYSLILISTGETAGGTRWFGRLNAADLAALPYLRAVVKETLRVRPPLVPPSSPRPVVGIRPAATTAMVNMWAITHDSAVWEDPQARRGCNGRHDEERLDSGLRVPGTVWTVALGWQSCKGFKWAEDKAPVT
ncbi:UNVERIFIED_CONTAM: cytochrome [Sesamum calycinum]|uniref:Cytochrome n=1 Tax=Sesamum calycinum TaxID=2727403 RepID=A0AAW2MMM8_9LAMI